MTSDFTITTRDSLGFLLQTRVVLLCPPNKKSIGIPLRSSPGWYARQFVASSALLGIFNGCVFPKVFAKLIVKPPFEPLLCSTIEPLHPATGKISAILIFHPEVFILKLDLLILPSFCPLRDTKKQVFCHLAMGELRPLPGRFNSRRWWNFRHTLASFGLTKRGLSPGGTETKPLFDDDRFSNSFANLGNYEGLND